MLIYSDKRSEIPSLTICFQGYIQEYEEENIGKKIKLSINTITYRDINVCAT